MHIKSSCTVILFLHYYTHIPVTLLIVDAAMLYKKMVIPMRCLGKGVHMASNLQIQNYLPHNIM